jgi:DNA-binding MarR family transcriptional regulator
MSGLNPGHVDHGIHVPNTLQPVAGAVDKQHAGWHVADITKATGAQPSAVTMAKQKLVQQGLIIEQFPERDKRVTKVYLTDDGRTTAANMWRMLRALVAAEDAIRSSGTIG